MKKRGIFKSLVAVTALGLALILGFSSCSRDAAQEAEVCFTIPQEVFNQIAQAARAASDIKVTEGTGSDMEIVSVPDENNLTFTISLYDSSNKLIDTQAQSKTFAKWLEASANNEISYTFTNITVGSSIYATASATAVIDGTTKEICSSQSDPILITQGSNVIPLELTFTVVEEKEPEEPVETNDKITLNITINNNDAIQNVTPSVSLFAFTESDANLFTDTGYSGINNPQTFISKMNNTENLITIAKNEMTISQDGKTLTIKKELKPSAYLQIDKPVYLLAILNYDDWDLFEDETLAAENASIISCRGYVKISKLTANELMEISVAKTNIPCEVKISKKDDSTYTKVAYLLIPSYNDNSATKTTIRQATESQIENTIPAGYKLTESLEAITSDFSNNYVTAAISLEKADYNGSGNLTINGNANLLDITATPSEKFYLNTGAISLKAVEESTNTDLSTSTDVTWNAKLLYGGVDINGYGIEYYKLSKDSNKWSVQLANKLATAGTYQLYVTATYNGVTSSQITNVDVLDGNYYGFDVTASDFKQKYGSLANGASSEMKALNEDTTIEFYGELNPSTAIEDFIDILAVLPEIYCNLSVDMSGLTGITELPTNVHFINPNPNNPDALEDTYFYSSNLTSIILPGSFITLKKNSFRQDEYNPGCLSLTSITAPVTLTQIEDGAFSGCDSLEEIILPENCPAGTVDSNGCLIVKDGSDKKLFFVPSSYKANLTSINFATDFPGVTKICDYAFYKCSTLSGVINLSNITSIGAYAFYDCGDITELTNYDDLKFIGEKAFWAQMNASFDEITFNSDDIVIEEQGLYAKNLNVEFDITEENYDNVRDNIFNGLGSLQHITFNGQTVLPDLLESELVGGAISGNSNKHPKALFNKLSPTTITFNNTENFKIGDYQFAKSSSLQTITTNGGKIIEVGNYAFYSLSASSTPNKISSIDLSACTKIGDFAFYECLYFTDATLDLSNVQIIGNQAFKNSSSSSNSTYYTYHSKVSTINLSSATAIGDEAFYGWTSLTTITQLGSSAGCTIGSKAFNSNVTAGIALTTVGSTTNVVDLTNVKSLGIGAFQNCRQIKKIDFSNNTQLTEITKDAFGENYGLTEIVFSSSITKIGDSAFSNCSALTDLDLSSTNVNTIGQSAFYNCSKLTALDLSSTNVKIIGQSAFYNCFKDSAPTTFNLGNVTQIGPFAFQNSSKLTNVTIPNTVIALGYKAFTGVTSLSIASDPEGKTGSWYAFNYTSGVNQIRNELWNEMFSNPRTNFTDAEIQIYETEMTYPKEENGTKYFVPFTVPEGSSIQAEIKNVMTGSGDAATTQPRLIRQYKDSN